ncbi:MAG: DUF3592 domain-containing protein [Phycisphaeraceae bacterium]|nr:DUF3592 domain-containing protein [Phycisphaeraceae bacterium]
MKRTEVGKQMLGLLLLCAILLAGSWHFYVRYREIVAGHDWIPTTGTLISVELGYAGGKDLGDAYRVVVSYRYVVGDTEYAGSRYRPTERSSNVGYNEYLVLGRELSPNAAVTVYYDAKQPSHSALTRGHSGDESKKFAIVLAICGGAVLMYGLAWSLRTLTR